MLNKRIAAAVAGASIASLALIAPSASAEEILEIGDKCFVEKVVTQEEVVGTRTVTEPAPREGDWPIGKVEGPEGWTFDYSDATGGQGQGDDNINATIPTDTPAGEYTAEVFHFGYSKNQVSESVPFTVFEEDVTERRTWTDREEVPCENDDSSNGGEESEDRCEESGNGGDESSNGGDTTGAECEESMVASGQQTGFVDYKVMAQQQAMNAQNAPQTPAPAAAAPVTEEVTPKQAAQQTQLANNGIGGTLIALAVGLLAAAAGAGLLLKRRSN